MKLCQEYIFTGKHIIPFTSSENKEDVKTKNYATIFICYKINNIFDECFNIFKGSIRAFSKETRIYKEYLKENYEHNHNVLTMYL